MENQELEYKESWRDEYLETLSAFANTQGGKLIIGINDKQEVIGVKNLSNLLENLPNKIIHKLNITPEIHLQIKEGKEILEIFIKPSNTPISYDGKFYIRSGSTTQLLEGQELMNFLLTKSGESWDGLIEYKATYDDIDQNAINKFISLAKDRLPSIEKEKEMNWINILKKLKLIQNDHIKRAGILLFGKNPQDFYIQAITKIGKFRTATDIISTDIIEGNLFNQLQKIMEILKTKYLISKIEYEDIHRREILEYPYEALREAIINALIHRDYMGTSNIQIRIYNDKLVIMNEGKLPPDIPVEKLKTVHISKPRNPLIASVFYYAGFIETWGRGTIKIIEECKKQGLPEPNFENDHNVMKVTLYKDLYNEETLRSMRLSERQIKAVLYVKEKTKITNKEYREMFGLSDEKARLDLNELIRKKILLPKGKAKTTYYVLEKFGNFGD